MPFTVQGTIMQTPTSDRLQVLSDHVVTVDEGGLIETVVPATEHAGPIDRTLTADQYLLPGLIDLHVHAPQWPQLGTGLDRTLEDWLFSYTFPLEARFSDLAFATRVWGSLVPGLLRRGTTTAVYFASIHQEATVALAEACRDAGQRAYVGRVAMDHPSGTPEWYRDADAQAGVEASHASITAIASADPSGLVQAIVTPRFVPACTDALLEGLGELAQATGTLIQTHCSESDWEHDYVQERFGHTDAVVLERFGLATTNSVLAHSDHVTVDDQRLLASVGAGIAHCPMSNAYFANAVLPVRQVMDNEVAVGLGTDIAGGSEPGLLAQCGHAVTVSRLLEDGVDVAIAADRRGVPDSRIDVVTAFHLATVGGAKVLGTNTGIIEAGRPFDAFVVETGAANAVQVWDEIDDDERIFEKLVRLSGPNDISTVWVNGRAVI